MSSPALRMCYLPTHNFKGQPRNDTMLLTYNIKHGRNLTDELAKAKQVAEFTLQAGSRARYLTTKDVKDIGLNAVISGQVLRKYSRNSSQSTVSN